MKVLNINTQQNNYNIYIEKGILKNIGQLVRKIYNNRKILIITDSNVNSLYGVQIRASLAAVGFDASMVVLEPGENSKSFNVLLDVYNEMICSEISRSSLIIGLGGGVVGDLSGFAASTFLRGVPFIQIPTTLLAQVDSSIGGKVAVNLPSGKNLVGSFYHPVAVYIDPEVLGTLDKRFFSDGMAEVIKYGAIKNPKLFNQLSAGREYVLENIEDIIYNCCSIKKEVVERDERDFGERMLLNFGHTIGHAIEKYFDYSTYTHGEAVAMGMHSITEMSEKIGITQQGTASSIKNILMKYNLPWELPEIDSQKILRTILIDKKNLGGTLNLILLKSIGESTIYKLNTHDSENFFDFGRFKN
jgi:3-dehydroquinate synthase